MRPSAARTTLLAVALSYGSQDVALRLVLTLTAAPSPPAVALVKALIQAAAFAPPYFLSRRDGAAPPWSVSLGLAAAELLLERPREQCELRSVRGALAHKGRSQILTRGLAVRQLRPQRLFLHRHPGTREKHPGHRESATPARSPIPLCHSVDSVRVFLGFMFYLVSDRVRVSSS